MDDDYALRKQRLAKANKTTAILVISGIIALAILGLGAWLSGSASRAKATTAPGSSRATDSLGACMREGFGGGGNPTDAAAWYSSIRSYEMRGNSVYVHTSLFDKPSNQQDAQGIRGAVYSCVQSLSLPVNSVFVRASNDHDLAYGSVPGR